LLCEKAWLPIVAALNDVLRDIGQIDARLSGHGRHHKSELSWSTNQGTIHAGSDRPITKEKCTLTPVSTPVSFMGPINDFGNQAVWETQMNDIIANAKQKCGCRQ
jgi:hypothetical protein